MTIQVHPEVLITLQSSNEALWKSSDVKDSKCDDEAHSVCTLSTSSTSDSESPMRVSFAEELVSDTWTRPYTDEEDVPDLYYSKEETDRFRQEYRLERKLLSEEEEEDSLELPRSHNISKVVVLHDDKLETYDEQCASFDTPEFWSGSITWW